MEETIFPPSPNWFSPNIIAIREDGCISYGSKTTIVILKANKNTAPEMSLIRNAHKLKITAVAFAPSNCSKSVRKTVVSCSEDGFVKLWKTDTLTASIGHKSHWEPNKVIGKIVSLDWSTANPCYIVSAAENNTIVLWEILSNNTSKFSFQKNFEPTVISCCPHSEKIIAVGGKSGQVHIISLTGSGDLLYKLRGHDNKIQSLSWCPVPYNVFNADEVHEEFLLASACQNQEIFIWRTGSEGKCETKFQIPKTCLTKTDNQCHAKIGNSFSYTALLWFEPYKIYSSASFGELIYFDIKTYLKNRAKAGTNSWRNLNKQSNFIKVGHYFHNKRLFAIVGLPPKPEIVLYKNTQVKSKLKFTHTFNCKVTEKLENENDADMKWEAVVPKTSSLLWTAAQDRKLVACELESSKLKMIINYHTMNNFVYCAAVSPHDPNKIAIGAGDGMIRLWNLTDPTDMKIFWQKIKDRVMSLAWHPIKDGILAYGTSEGRVGLVDTNSNKLPNVFKPGQPHPAYSLSWGPPFTLDGPIYSKFKSELYLYAIGNNLSVYNPTELTADPLNLSSLIPFPCTKQTDVCWKPDLSVMAVGNEDGSISLVEPFRFEIVCTVPVYKKFIESIAWHPSSTSLDLDLSPYHGYFTAGSTDNQCVIRVYNFTIETEKVKVEQVARLKGHYGHIASVAWSPHMNGRLVSSSADLSVQIWDVIHQIPLVNFTPSGMALFSIFSPVHPDYILTGCKTEALHVWKASAQSRMYPVQVSRIKKDKKEKNMSLSGEIKVGETEDDESVSASKTGDLEMAETSAKTKTSKELKMFTRSWKGNTDDQLTNLYNLLSGDGKGKHEGNYSLSILGDEEDFIGSLLAEEESLRKSNRRSEFYELALWKGTIKELVEERIKTGQLNEFLVSLAPIVSPRLWQEACFSYSKTLTERKTYRRAASYLIACHKIYEAIQLLMDADLYMEALCIARSRLPKSDPIVKSAVRGYAQWLFKTGSFLRACECYLYLEDYFQVAKICSKVSRAEYLSLAALAARKCGSDLEPLEATNAIFKCFDTNNFELARRICSDHENLRHLGLILYIYQTIHQLDVGELVLKKDILSHVRESYNCENVYFPSCVPKHFHKYGFYSNRREVLRVLTEELFFAICASDMEEVTKHVLQALCTCSRYAFSSADDEELLYKFCVWLSPQGFLTGNDYFSMNIENLSPKIKSMRAFLCAALIKHLSCTRVPDEVPKYFGIINKLKEDLFDEGSFVYFKNLIRIEIHEKRLSEKLSKVSRRTSKSAHNSGTCATAVPKDSHPLASDKINGEDAFENWFAESNTERSQPLKNISGSSGYDYLSPKETLTDESVEIREAAAGDAEFENPELENEIKMDLELLKRLKLESENFERVRVGAPDLNILYIVFKKLCDSIAGTETLKLFLENVRKRWLLLK